MALGGGSSCRSRDLDRHPELELLGTARFGGLPYLVSTRSSVPFADGEPLGQWLVSTSPLYTQDQLPSPQVTCTGTCLHTSTSMSTCACVAGTHAHICLSIALCP